uniref:Pyrrolo-quinoline quinone repeat domain-containing protein n=1 Tax=Neobodo designis TaxID=312471 RepID=A0A7S1Q709_NEODS|mmetsp:Transcript_33710/g.104072  ORF Transcript_33710/g.104072 Transcript_33710/m.104072 type:complete len:426 (+) Transcript_33710:41-1318(+)
MRAVFAYLLIVGFVVASASAADDPAPTTPAPPPALSKLWSVPINASLGNDLGLGAAGTSTVLVSKYDGWQQTSATLTAFDANTGAVKWTASPAVPPQQPWWAEGPPNFATSTSFVAFVDSANVLQLKHADSGETAWMAPVPERINATELALTPGESDASKVSVAVVTTAGLVVYRNAGITSFTRATPSAPRPVISAYANAAIFGTQGDGGPDSVGRLVAVNLTSGEILWNTSAFSGPGTLSPKGDRVSVMHLGTAAVLDTTTGEQLACYGGTQYLAGPGAVGKGDNWFIEYLVMDGDSKAAFHRIQQETQHERPPYRERTRRLRNAYPTVLLQMVGYGEGWSWETGGTLTGPGFDFEKGLIGVNPGGAFVLLDAATGGVRGEYRNMQDYGMPDHPVALSGRFFFTGGDHFSQALSLVAVEDPSPK